MAEETLLTCSSCGNTRPKSDYSKTQWKKGHTSDGGGGGNNAAGKAKCKRCIYMETNDVVDFHVGDINTAPDTPSHSRDVIDMSDLVDTNNNDGNNNNNGGGNDNDSSGVPALPLISPPVSPPTLRNSTEVTSDDDDDEEDGVGGGMNNQITMSNDTDDAVVDDMLNQALAVAGVTVLPTKSSLSQDDRDIEVYEDQTASLEDNDDDNGGETAAATAAVAGGEMVELPKEVEKEEEESSSQGEEEEDDDEIQEIDPPTAVSDGEVIKPPVPLQDSESIEDEDVKKVQIDDDDDGRENEEEDDKKPIVGAMAVGALAAGGGAAAAAAAASKSPVEPTTGELEGEDGIRRGLVEELDVDGGPPIPLEDDIILEKGDDVSGEHFDLSDKEFQKQVVPMIPSRDSSLQRNSSVRVWSPYNDDDGLQVNPPDYDTSQQQRSAAAAPTASKPKFFPIEAKPVAEKKDHPSHNSQQGTSSGPVYTAERVYEESCWKRHRRCICLMVPFFLLLIAVVVLVVLFLLGPLDWRQPASTSTESQFCEIINLGPFYQSECEFCIHTTGMDPKTGIIWRDSKEGDGMIQFIPNTGTYVPGQTFPYLFHEEVAILGNYAALGDRWMGNGTVYMYEKDDSGVWSNIMNITPETLTSDGDVGGAEFGTAIVFDGDRMVVGAPWDMNEGGNNIMGSVYIYQLQNDGAWVEEARLYHNSTLEVAGSFGFAVALKGDTLVVAGGYDSKHAFVYKFDSTSNEWKQPPVNGTLSSEDCEDRFGYSVGVTDTGGILVECPMEKSGSGAVYYYTPSSDGGYKLSQKITTFDNEPLPELGEKIIVNNDFLLLTTDAEMVNGTAYIFQNSGGKWKEAAFVDAPAGAPAFGIDAAFVGEHLFLAYWGNIYSYILQCAN